MSSVLSAIDDTLAAWMEAQPVFFVATAPLSGSGQVNVSPKGMAGTFRVLTAHQIAYLDYHASGVETIAHLREPGNGRICVMFCAFAGRTILDLHQEKKGAVAYLDYGETKNARSIDGLPAMTRREHG